jgi:hypothetical protein
MGLPELLKNEAAQATENESDYDRVLFDLLIFTESNREKQWLCSNPIPQGGRPERVGHLTKDLCFMKNYG